MGSRLPLLLFAVLVAAASLAAFFLLDDARGPRGEAAASERAAAVTSPVSAADLRGASPAATAAPEEGERSSLRAVAAPVASAPAAVAAAAPSAGALAVSGRVLDRWGAPVAGAEVTLTPPLTFDGSFRWDRDRSEAVTDGEGRFELASQDLRGGELAFGADGFEPHQLPLAAGAPGARIAVGDVVLATGARIRGRVVDAAGRGVAGVEIEREQPDGAPLLRVGPFMEGGPLAVSGEGGEFAVERLALGPFRLRFESPLHVSRVVEGTTSEDEPAIERLLVELEDGSTIEGLVAGRPADAPPIEAVATRIASGSGFGAFMGGGNERRAAVLGDGSFRIAGLVPDSEYRVRVVAAAGDSPAGPGRFARFGANRSYSESATVAAGTRDVRLAWRAPAGLSLRAIDAATGAPIERFRARTSNAGRMAFAFDETESDWVHPDGRIELADLDARGRTISLTVEADGYELYELEGIALSAGESRDLGDVALHAAPSLEVAVTDALTGAPVQGARVRVSAPPADDETAGVFTRAARVTTEARRAGGRVDRMEMGGGPSRSATTDEHGIALVANPGLELATLTVESEQHATSREDGVALPSEGRRRHDVAVGQGGLVTVRVIDADDQPLGGAAVEHRTAGAVRVMPWAGGPTVTDAEGVARFERLAPGEHRFRLGESGARSFAAVVVMDGQEQDDSWQTVLVEQGGAHELLLRAERRCEVAGRVREGGEPLAGAEVELSERSAGRQFGIRGFRGGFAGMSGGMTARTDGEGRYRIPDVKAGDYTFIVSHPRRALADERDLTVDDPSERFDVDLAATAVEGRVTDPDGKPVEGLRVRAERVEVGGGGRSMRAVMIAMADDGEESGGVVQVGDPSSGEGARTDEDGRYRLVGLPADADVAVVVEGPSILEARTEPFRLAPEEVKTGVDLVAAPAGTVRVVLKRAGGGAVGGMHLVRASQIIDDAEGPPGDPQFAGPNGRATLRGLAPGRWRVVAEAFGGEGPEPVATGEVEVVAGETRDLELELPPE